MKASTKNTASFFAYISPWLLSFLLFTLAPLLFSLYFSFTDYKLLSTPVWCGFDNYVYLFTKVPEFWKGFGNTAYFTVMRVVFALGGGLLVAVLLHAMPFCRRLFQTLYYIPGVLPFMSATLLWSSMFATNGGLLNNIFEMMHLPAVEWLNMKNAKNSILLMTLWSGLGGTATMFLTALCNVPQDLAEAMRLDGANAFVRFFRLTVPMISATTFYLFIMEIIGSLQFFGPVLLLTNGGPSFASTTLTLQIYNWAFTDKQMGFASAYAWIVFVIVLAFTVIFFKFGGRSVYYADGGE